MSLAAAAVSAQPTATSARYRDPRYTSRKEGIPSGPPDTLAPRPAEGGSLRSRHAVPADDLYLSPVGVAVSADGGELYVTCENAGRLLVLDAATGARRQDLEVGAYPYAIHVSTKGRRLYVSNRRDDEVALADLDVGRVTRRYPTGDDPHGLATDPEERRLYVANLATHNLSIIDLESGRELRRLATGKYPFEVALAPDGRRLFVSSQMTLPVPFREPSVLELTTVDVTHSRVTERRDLPGTIIGQGAAVSPDGRFVVVALEIPKNLLPETQIHQGWMVTYAVAVSEVAPGGRTAFLLLDEPARYFPDPFALAFSPDGKRLFVTSSGVDTLTVVDWDRALERLMVGPDGRIGLSDGEIERLSRDLAASNGYVATRLATGRNPKGVAVSPDGRRVFVANRLSDTVSVYDGRALTPLGEYDLGGPKEDTLLRRGAVVFNFATISFQRQLSCATCHPENNLDGLVYDIAADGGMGKNLTDNKTLRGIAETAPFKWSGRNPDLPRQEGPRAAQLFFRSHGFEPEDVAAITAFIEAIPLEGNRYRFQELNEFQRRGREMFARKWTNDGRYIPVANRCVTCHPPPLYTSRRKHDVGSQAPFDDERGFDTPQLNGMVDQAPYLHDGRCWSLEEIWTKHNPYDTHGVTNDMVKEQLNDLIEYLKVL